MIAKGYILLTTAVPHPVAENAIVSEAHTSITEFSQRFVVADITNATPTEQMIVGALIFDGYSEFEADSRFVHITQPVEFSGDNEEAIKAQFFQWIKQYEPA